MIHYINGDKLKKISSLDYSRLFIIFDFDRTITSANSVTSWGLLEDNNIIDKDYKNDSKKLYEYYRKIEIDNNIDDTQKALYMKKWVLEQIQLLTKYNINQTKFEEILKFTDLIKFRSGTTNFFYKLNELNIPIMVVSAGLGNVVIKALEKNNCLLDNVEVISNKIYFDENIIKIDGAFINGINKDDIVIPKNFLKKINGKKSIILFGDQISDLSIMKKFQNLSQISIGFLANDTKDNLEEYKKSFDVVVSENENFNNLSKILIKK